MIVVRAIVGVAAPLVLAGLLALCAPPAIYLWIKAFHVVAVIGWMGSMLAVLWLFVAHARIGAASAGVDLVVLERRAVQHVVNPAMMLTWGLGLWLAWQGEWWSSGWFQAKLLLVLALSGVHGWVVGAIRRFAANTASGSVRLYGGVAVGSALLAAAAVTLAVVKPM